ncbi:MAG: ATP-dependent DNA helicase RecG [candidate division WOR-3 bacterium]|nr:ATP-dependent DNA helicase RecG [candidate division WOR-3 bacterium]
MKQVFKADISAEVQYLKGIGPKRAQYLRRIGVETIEDFLFLVPRRYIDRSQIVKIRDLKIKTDSVVMGKIIACGTKKTRNKGEVVRIMVSDDTGMLECIWFNRPDLKDKFKVNQKIIVSGIVNYYNRKQIVNPHYQILSEEIIGQSKTSNDLLYAIGIIPVYPLTEGLSIWDIRRPMKYAIDNYLRYLNETLPVDILKKYSFPEIKNAIKNIHFPETIAQAEKAKARLIYEEFFYLELLLALRKLNSVHQKKGYRLIEQGTFTKKLLSLLPFELTDGQKKVLSEIKDDLAKEIPMNRLLQGDVGSGKTVIAIYAMLIAIENGFQSALMAPTEILAEQHYLVWHKRLEKIGVKTCLLTGSTKPKDKTRLSQEIEQGMINIVFGTHALIEQNIKFKQLGLAIIDEQHRFGVMQRAALINKGVNPDFLVMTATPIPRTLQMTLYGDLDISILSEKPPGRKKIVTRLVTEKERASVYNFIQAKINEGRQIYIVCPLIEESEKLDLKAAIKTYEEIQKVFSDKRIGLVHGRLKSSERIELMEKFRKHELDILVTTTVIEVGVDIPNATVMVIEHPERFGLAQLHQLRGRIGRGSETSYCILMLSNSKFSPAYERLKFFQANDDGFLLAEKDLELRGPGEILGTRQHGLPDLKIADLQKDRHLLFQARDDAFALIKEDSNFALPENRVIKMTLNKKFKERIELLRVG